MTEDPEIPGQPEFATPEEAAAFWAGWQRQVCGDDARHLAALRADMLAPPLVRAQGEHVALFRSELCSLDHADLRCCPALARDGHRLRARLRLPVAVPQ